MTEQCDASFENEELIRKAEIETARARERIMAEIDAAEKPEPYEFQAFSAYSMLAIQASVGGLFCMNCIHRIPHRPICAQMHCGTLDRIDNRLWEVER